MQVAIDARSMQSRLTGGVGRSLANLLPRLRERVDLTLLTDAGLPRLSTDLPQVSMRRPVRSASVSWVQISAARWARNFDGVFHGPFYVIPAFLSGPGVVTLHDLSWEHHPEWFTRARRISFQWQCRRAANVAAAIITVSEFVKADIVRTYNVPPEKILVCGHGVDPVFSPGASEAREILSLGVSSPYIVALGGAARRNLGTAIEAWRILRRRGFDVSLVVAGKERPPAEAGLIYAGTIDDAGFAALLAGSSVFLYPTLYEGFGMPALEAMGAGTVVVAARVSALPEVMGDAAEWAESLHPEDLAAAVARVLEDEAGASARRARSLGQARAMPGWEHAAATHVAAYQLAEESRGRPS